MPSRILLLRAINVGARRVPMPVLRELLSEAGMQEVRTYLQSGNVVVCSGEPPDELGARCQELVSARFGFDVPVIVRTAEQLESVLARDPFAGLASDPKRYWVSFLDRELSAEEVERLDARRAGEERMHVHGCELYGWFPDFTARSKLATAFGAPAKGVTATARNWTTVSSLHVMASGEP